MEKVKKILIITGWFPNEFETGKGIFVQQIAEAQLKYTNCSITIICPIPYFPKINFPFLPSKFRIYSKIKYSYLTNGYKVYYPKYLKLPTPLFDRSYWYFFYKSIYRTIKKEKFEYDIIHSHGLFPDSYSAALISRQFHKPLVVHLHDSFIDLIYKQYHKKIDFIFKTMLKILPVSNFQAQALLNTVNKTDVINKISVIYNGVDINVFKTKTKEENKTGLFRIVFIGGKYKGKGLSILINAIANLKARYLIKVDIFGEGKDKLEFVKLIDQLGLSECFTFKGNIDNDKLAKLLPDYNLLVLPTEFETFGVVLIEAMACGIPVVSTNICAIPEIISNEEVGILISPGNVNELTAAIEKAINKNWNKEYIRKHAVKFSIQETAKNIDKVYECILDENN